MVDIKKGNKCDVKETDVKDLGNELNEAELDQASGGAKPACRVSGGDEGCMKFTVKTGIQQDLTVTI